MMQPPPMQQQEQPFQFPNMQMMQQQPMKLDPYGQQMGNIRQILMGAMR